MQVSCEMHDGKIRARLYLDQYLRFIVELNRYINVVRFWEGLFQTYTTDSFACRLAKYQHCTLCFTHRFAPPPWPAKAVARASRLHACIRRKALRPKRVQFGQSCLSNSWYEVDLSPASEAKARKPPPASPVDLESALSLSATGRQRSQDSGHAPAYSVQRSLHPPVSSWNQTSVVNRTPCPHLSSKLVELL